MAAAQWLALALRHPRRCAEVAPLALAVSMEEEEEEATQAPTPAATAPMLALPQMVAPPRLVCKRRRVRIGPS